MPADHIRYDVLVQKALRGMVRDVLADTAKTGLLGEHHFFITFDTSAEGVQLSERMRAQYPEEMTIVLQHQFWDLKVTDEAFEVGLSFGGVSERLHIPFAAIKAFADPSVQFTLQFETLTADEAEPQPKPETQARGKRPLPARSIPPEARLPAAAPQKAAEHPQDKPGDKAGAEVVRLDRFRKK
jgi:uncharacterized protein